MRSRIYVMRTFTITEQIWNKRSDWSELLHSLLPFLQTKAITLYCPPPRRLFFPCLWTSALRASVSRHKPEGDTLSSILRYMVLNEERAGKQTACLHINTPPPHLCHSPSYTYTQWLLWCIPPLASKWQMLLMIKQPLKINISLFGQTWLILIVVKLNKH